MKNSANRFNMKKKIKPNKAQVLSPGNNLQEVYMRVLIDPKELWFKKVIHRQEIIYAKIPYIFAK